MMLHMYDVIFLQQLLGKVGYILFRGIIMRRTECIYKPLVSDLNL